MIHISEQELERMLTGRQADLGFGLTVAEMEMVEVIGDRRVERRQLAINQQMMVARVWPINARRRQPHSAQAKMDDRLGRNRLTVLDIDEIDQRARGGRRWPTSGLCLSERNVRRCKIDESGKKCRSEGSQKHRMIPSINGQAGGQIVRLLLGRPSSTTPSSNQASEIYQRLPNLSKGLPLSCLSVYLPIVTTASEAKILNMQAILPLRLPAGTQLRRAKPK
jgi:hypothetical protein